MTNWAIVNALPRIQDTGHEDGLFFEGLVGQVVFSPESTSRLNEFVSGQAKPIARPGMSGDGR